MLTESRKALTVLAQGERAKEGHKQRKYIKVMQKEQE
jgi:hypothetical protein